MADDIENPPIQELDYLMGLKVVDIGDLRIARGKSKRPFTTCKHNNVIYDANERRIWCKDCEKNVDPFDVIVSLSESFDKAYKQLEAKAQQLKEAEKHNIRRLATRAIDKAWSKNKTIPACPMCGHGLFPEYFRIGRITMIGRDYATKLKEKALGKKHGTR